MSAYVVKGRGPSRGKYLRREWRRGHYVATWVESQRRADRHDNHPNATGAAREYGGYVVRIVLPRAAAARRGAMAALIEERATDASPRNGFAHYVDGTSEVRGLDFDGATEFCGDCAKKKAAKAKRLGADASVQGGFGGEEHYDPPFCRACDGLLEGGPSQRGADEMLRALAEECSEYMNGPDGWADLAWACEALSDDDLRWRKVARIVDAASAAQPAKAGAA
jgi:hypothetical protein